MGYMVLTTRHHDGFCLFDTRQTGYRMTPFRLDAAIWSANMFKPAAPKACA